MQAKRKKIIVSVSSDLVSDNRVHKVCTTLWNNGFNVLLIGRKLPNSLPTEKRSYSTKRIRLLFNKSVLFYAEFNIRLFFLLLFSRYDVLLSNDLDTLPTNALLKILKRKPLIYDSHEYFTEAPELIDRPVVQKIWQRIEKKAIKNVDAAYTVCDSIAAIYQQKYAIKFAVIRNLPFMQKQEIEKTDNSVKTILYQGALNIGRGLEQAILAMQYIDNAQLIIAGDGDVAQQLKTLTFKKELSNKVKFLGRLSIEELKKIAPTADLGISIEEDLGLNYRYALPNKLFDYIQAQTPVLVTDLPEMARIVEKYKIGTICKSLQPKKLAKDFKNALFDDEKRLVWSQNLPLAAKQLTWEKEEPKLLQIFQNFG